MEREEENSGSCRERAGRTLSGEGENGAIREAETDAQGMLWERKRWDVGYEAEMGWESRTEEASSSWQRKRAGDQKE